MPSLRERSAGVHPIQLRKSLVGFGREIESDYADVGCVVVQALKRCREVLLAPRGGGGLLNTAIAPYRARTIQFYSLP